ncbi:hypothetical protein BDW02DRAFT_572624 [Decorospora gaudefroyi]|uniref:Uncharacterized protein n=1 Tax=Decorospora gaudefroyi TaxID=184978 RepID=A0A6A5K1I0_9PLEO|nr:hypothetical protein BDW02DRAFT_572624 [Decorospora gaudefroyi]
MAFDQAEFITLLTDYYEFCNRIFWDNSVVSEAPAGGWPSITQETMANLHKTDAAIELLRHLPFPDFDPPEAAYGRHAMMRNTRVQEYRTKEVQDQIRSENGESYVEPLLAEGDSLTPSCICFGKSQNLGGYQLIIDTADGCVYWQDVQGGHDEPEPELNVWAQERYNDFDGAESWRYGFNVYRPRDFFALCKQRFRELRWIGIQTDVVEAERWRDYWPDAEPENLSLMRKMRRAGWPGDGEGRDWDREAFRASLYDDSEEEDEDAIRERPTDYVRT